jgi:hypothetical protein
VFPKGSGRSSRNPFLQVAARLLARPSPRDVRTAGLRTGGFASLALPHWYRPHLRRVEAGRRERPVGALDQVALLGWWSLDGVNRVGPRARTPAGLLRLRPLGPLAVLSDPLLGAEAADAVQGLRPGCGGDSQPGQGRAVTELTTRCIANVEVHRRRQP